MENNFYFHKFEAYLLTERRVSINTITAYRRDITQLLSFLKARNDLSLAEVTPEELKLFLVYLHNQQMSARSMARKISAIKTFFSYLSQHYEWKNCAHELRLPKMEKKLPQYLSEADIKAIFKVADCDTSPHGLRNRVMLYLMYASGMRVSELTALKISDVHCDTAMVTVSGKGGKQRIIPLPQKVCHMLQEYINNELGSTQVIGHKNKMGPVYLFPTKYSGKVKPISRQAFWVILNDLWQKTGIEKKISPHQLRHSLATHLLKKGVDLRSLQMILGHENLSTVQVYTHVETSFLRSVYDKKHPRS